MPSGDGHSPLLDVTLLKEGLEATEQQGYYIIRAWRDKGRLGRDGKWGEEMKGDWKGWQEGKAERRDEHNFFYLHLG